MELGFNEAAEIHFVKTMLWLWDQYGNGDELSSRKIMQLLVGALYDYEQPHSPFENLLDLYEYFGGESEFKHQYNYGSLENQLGRPQMEESITLLSGNVTEMTLGDQLHFADIGYKLLYLGWTWPYLLRALYSVCMLLDMKVPEKSPAIVALILRLRSRLRTLDEDSDWNKEHNSMSLKYATELKYSFIEEFYSEIILPCYYGVDLNNIRWEKHVKVGQGTIAHYFVSRGRSYILLTADDSQADFMPGPMYELVKYHGYAFIELRFTDDMYIPGIIGTYQLYAEQLATSFQALTLESPDEH